MVNRYGIHGLNGLACGKQLEYELNKGVENHRYVHCFDKNTQGRGCMKKYVTNRWKEMMNLAQL
ncbi:hypothetical protein [Sphingobacterium lactis]|uniref:hypothetical protein n=1 Tax=Sphingobacterium lactis TaxID=797291 RepID=UPI003DA5FC8E